MDLLTLVSHGHAVLGDAALIVGDEPVGRVHDGAGTAVVALQPEHLCLREILLEIEDVLDLGPAEAVNGLGVVTHHTEVLVTGSQLAQNEILRHIGVLILVHQDVVKAPGNVCERLRRVFQEDVHVKEDVVKVHHARLLAGLAVEPVYLINIGLLVMLVVLQVTAHAIGIRSGRDKVVLSLGDAGEHLLGLVQLVVQRELLEAGLDAAHRVCSIVDGKGLREPEHLRVIPQETDEHRVKSSHPQAPGPLFTHHDGNAFLHLPRRLFRKGQGQDTVRCHPLFYQICYT